MTITTNFDIGDTVYTIDGTKVIAVVVYQITIYIKGRKTTVKYTCSTPWVGGSRSYLETSIFSSKEDAARDWLEKQSIRLDKLINN